MIPCPGCGAPLGANDARCAQCGGPRLLKLGPDHEGPACSLHTDRKASASCPRCGVFACATCLAVSDDGRLLCRACHDLEAKRPPVFPWSPRQRGLVVSFFAMVWNMVVRPSQTLSNAPVRTGTGGAIVFATIAFGASLLSSAALLAAAAGEEGQGMFGDTILFGALVLAGWLVVLPVVEWTALKLVGAPEARFATQARASAYALAPMAIAIPLLGFAALPTWCLVLKLIGCRKLQGISWAQAIFATFALPALMIALALFLRLDAYVTS